MRKVLVVREKISVNEIRAVDAVGRGQVLAVSSSYNVGDSILVVNGIVVRKIKTLDTRIYEV